MLSLSALIYSETIQLVCISTPSKIKDVYCFITKSEKKVPILKTGIALFFWSMISIIVKLDRTLKIQFCFANWIMRGTSFKVNIHANTHFKIIALLNHIYVCTYTYAKRMSSQFYWWKQFAALTSQPPSNLRTLKIPLCPKKKTSMYEIVLHIVIGWTEPCSDQFSLNEDFFFFLLETQH